MLIDRIVIDCASIVDFDSLHDAFDAVLGFPEFYGRNMNAWIDCMTSIDEPDDGMTTHHVAKGVLLRVELLHVAAFAERCPEVHDALAECAAFVNHRRVEVGEPPVLEVVHV